MKFKWPVAPELESFDNAEGVWVTVPPRYRVKDALDLSNWAYSMDRFSVTMAVVATCVPQISLRIGQQLEWDAPMQPDEMWVFLEETTCVVVLPALERLQTEMRNTRQGADETLEVCIAHIQKIEADSSQQLSFFQNKLIIFFRILLSHQRTL